MRRASLLLLLFALLCASVVGDDAECASVCAARLSAATSELHLAASQQQEAVVASERKACDLRVAEESKTTSKVRVQLKAAESQAEELRAASAGTEGELSALNVRANQLEAQLAASQKERTSTLETLALRGGELEKVQRTLKEVQEGRAQDKAALAALRAELDTAKVAQQLQLAALQSELDSLRSSVLPPVLRPLLAAAGDVCTQLAARAGHAASSAAASPHVAAAWRHISEAWARATQLVHDSGGLEMVASALDSVRGAAQEVIPQVLAFGQRCQHAVHVVRLELKEVVDTRFGNGVASALDYVRSAAQEIAPQALALAQRCQDAVQGVDFSGAWLRFQHLISGLRASVLHAGQSAREWVQAHQPSVDAWRLMSVDALQQFRSLSTSTFAGAGHHLQAGADSALLYASHLKQRMQAASNDHLPGAVERASAAAHALVASVADLWAQHAGDANPWHAAAAALAVALLGAVAVIERRRRSVKPAAAAQRNGRSTVRPSSSSPPPAGSPEPPVEAVRSARKSRGTRG